ncbi:MAG: ribonuclease BN [Haloferacaceae archaeon]
MTSLGEVYGGERQREASTGRLYAGVALFLAGALLVVAGIVVATTGVLRGGGTNLYDVREYGGILAGVGVPAVYLGILTVLPADRETRAAAGIGAAIAVLGVALFAHAYPCQWSGASCAPNMANLTLPTVGTYALGTMVTTWYVFVGIATFKRRNDPGGTVTMTVTRQGETKVVEVDPDSEQGSVGLFGSGTKDEAATSTTTAPGVDADYANDAEVMTSGPRRSTGSAGASTDGGATTNDVQEVGGSETENGAGPSAGTGVGVGGTDGVPADRYCGNCAHFEYVRTERGMQPYCGAHDEVMDDMDPCEAWQPNGR